MTVKEYIEEEQENDKINCFARIDLNTCGALTKKECKDCKFFKTNDQVDGYTKIQIKLIKEEVQK